MLELGSEVLFFVGEASSGAFVLFQFGAKFSPFHFDGVEEVAETVVFVFFVLEVDVGSASGLARLSQFALQFVVA